MEFHNFLTLFRGKFYDPITKKTNDKELLIKFKKSINVQLDTLFDSSGVYVDKNSSDENAEKGGQWDEIFKTICTHANNHRWGQKNGLEFFKNLGKGKGDTKTAFAVYYWLHTWNEASEKAGKQKNIHKDLAYEIDKLLFGKKLDEIFDLPKNTEENSFCDPFNDQIKQLTSDYFPRRAIAEKINQFITQNKKGYITVRGDAGSGKSTILASAVNRYKKSDNIYCIWHFIRLGSGFDRTISFLKSIYQQLATFCDLSKFNNEYEELLKNSRDDSCQLFIQNILEYASEKIRLNASKHLLVIVDALDEISGNDVTSSDGMVNLFYIPEYLPDNVFFLISSRNKEQQDYLDDTLDFQLSKDDDYQINDIRGYIDMRFASDRDNVDKWIKKNNISKEQFKNLLCEKSQYRFLYLHYVFQNINSFDKNSIPLGIEEYYEKQFKRLLTNQKEQLKLKKILAGIVNFYPEISLLRLSQYCNLEDTEIHDLIGEWLKIGLIEEIDNGAFYRFSHLSFYEYIDKYETVLSASRNSKLLFENLANALVHDIYP